MLALLCFGYSFHFVSFSAQLVSTSDDIDHEKELTRSNSEKESRGNLKECYRDYITSSKYLSRNAEVSDTLTSFHNFRLTYNVFFVRTVSYFNFPHGYQREVDCNS